MADLMRSMANLFDRVARRELVRTHSIQVPYMHGQPHGVAVENSLVPPSESSGIPLASDVPTSWEPPGDWGPFRDFLGEGEDQEPS